MIQRVIDRINGLEREEELRALTEHISVTSRAALEFLAHERGTNSRLEAHRLAAIQLRVVIELAARLSWLEAMCEDTHVEVDLRKALKALLLELAKDVEATQATRGESIALLEVAVLFHALLGRLRPWLPPVAVAFEPDAVIDALQLGIPDYLQPVLHRRFEDLWRLFHEQRTASMDRLSMYLGAMQHDLARVREVVAGALAEERNPQVPAVPRLFSPRELNPWLESEGRRAQGSGRRHTPMVG